MGSVLHRFGDELSAKNRECFFIPDG